MARPKPQRKAAIKTVALVMGGSIADYDRATLERAKDDTHSDAGVPASQIQVRTILN